MLTDQVVFRLKKDVSYPVKDGRCFQDNPNLPYYRKTIVLVGNKVVGVSSFPEICRFANPVESGKVRIG